MDYCGLCLAMLGPLLQLRNTRIRIFIRVIDYSYWLVLFLIEGLELELKRAVRQFAIDEPEILIHWSSKDHFPVRDHIHDFLVICVEHDLDVGMIQHLFEQAR